MTHQRALWRLMTTGLGLGILALVVGLLLASDLGALAVAYGWLVIGSSLFLGGGLAVRERLSRVTARSRAERPGTTIQGHRVF